MAHGHYSTLGQLKELLEQAEQHRLRLKSGCSTRSFERIDSSKQPSQNATNTWRNLAPYWSTVNMRSLWRTELRQRSASYRSLTSHTVHEMLDNVAGCNRLVETGNAAGATPPQTVRDGDGDESQ